MVRLQNVLKMSSRRICKTSRRCLEEVLKTSWRRLENVLKTSWRRLEDVWPRRIYWSWPRRLEDVFWRRMINKNIFVFIKTSWRRLLKTKTKDVFIKTNVCWDYINLNTLIICCLFSSGLFFCSDISTDFSLLYKAVSVTLCDALLVFFICSFPAN